MHYATSDNPRYEIGIKENLVILSRYPALESGVVDTAYGKCGLVAFGLIDTPHRPTLVFSGHPISADLIGETSKLGKTLGSDHYGLAAKLWNPPNS